MWIPDSNSQPCCIDEDLAHLAAEIPDNLRTADKLGLRVGLWCGFARSKKLKLRLEQPKFLYGFRQGDIVVEPSGVDILINGRLWIPAGRQEITEEINRGLTGSIKIAIWRLLSIGIGGQKKTKEILEYEQVSPRVESVKKTSWRVYGKYLNPEGVLVGQIVGNEDKPLCYIATRDGQSSIDVNIRFFVDQNYTWLRLDHTSQDRPVLEIIRAYFITVGKNKEAMVKA